MKAVVIHQHGDASALVVETDYPAPNNESSLMTEGEVLIQNHFSGLNFIDTYYRSGLYKQNLPFIGGQEGGGVIIQSTVDEFKEGDRVVYMGFGSYAEYTKVSASKVIKIPDGMDMKVAIACMVQGLTAHYLVTDATAGLIKPGEWCLIFSVGSGTTQWAAQMAKLQGYKVIGTTSKTKVDAVQKGSVDELIVLETAEGKTYADYQSVNIVQKVMDITNGQGCKCIIDGVGKSTTDIAIASIAQRGIWITFGNASGPVPPISVLSLLPKSAFCTRPKLGDYIATREELDARADDVFRWVASGELIVKVDKVFSLEQASDGHAYLESGQSMGKILFQL
jgi:NADPH:quinone reductase